MTKFNLNSNNKSTVKIQKFEDKKLTKHFPSSIREWNNSIYNFNKNTSKLIPISMIYINKVIKAYISLYNKKLERSLRSKRLLLRLKRLSSNKIYISNGEFKHTNNKVFITFYVFNRQKYNYLLTLRKKYFKTFLGKKRISNHNNLTSLIKRLNDVKNKGLILLDRINKDKFYLINMLNKIYNNKFKENKSIYKFVTNFYKKLIKKSFRKLQLYVYYRQLLFINKTKLNYTYLQYIKNYIENIYNKNVEFNIINLNRFYLNSDIAFESIKLKITKNRRKMIKYLNRFKNKIKTQKKNILVKESALYANNLGENNLLLMKDNLLENFTINNLKYRHVTGFRLEAKGRLTRRHTASRSISKLRYKGNLLNIDSSLRGMSSVILRENLEPNVQFSKLKSKSRIGSFGIKGWISGN